MPEASNRRRAVAPLCRIVCACAALLVLAAAPRLAGAQTATDAPVLLAQPNSLRAVALDSVTLKPEPFSTTAALPWWNADNRTRVMLFATNLQGAAAADLLVEAEDGAGRRHTLPVEYVGLVPDLAPQNVSQIVVRLVDAMNNVGDVLVRVTHRGAASNRARVAMGFFGGGPPDEAIKIAGRVTTASDAAVAGAILTLTGAANALTVTDAEGNYSFPSLPAAGNYTVTVSKLNYTFTPPSRTVSNLLGAARADFVASLMGFRISGRITEFGRPFAGVKVNLTGSRTASTVTDAEGNYSFTAPAEGNYTVAPESDAYAFSPASLAVHNLGADQTHDFTASPTKPTYTVSGFVKRGTAPLAGATMSLTGSRLGGAVTDASGFYSFVGLPGDGNYTVTASLAHHTFAQPSATFAGLAENKRQDFTAALSLHRISGQIVENGSPVVGLRVDLGGDIFATTTTDAVGTFAFMAEGGGDYVVTPVAGNRFFSPWSAAVNNLSEDRRVDFISSLGSPVDLSLFYVLDFDGSPQTVDYGDFFWPHLIGPDSTRLGHFYWEFWAMPGTNAFSRYMLSDGYGGAHALLFGFTAGKGDGRYWLYGNVWNGQTAVQFGGDDGPAPNEWGHYAVGWDGEYIYTYFNGVPVGLTPFAGPRMPGGSGNGAGKLFIGGSDHSNFMGRIAQVRGFENSNPRAGGLQANTFRPDTVFGLTQGTRTSPEGVFLTSFLRPGPNVADLAGGRVGVLRGTAFSAPDPTQSYPLPKFVIDPNAPTTSLARPPVPPAVQVDVPKPPPDGAAVFDSFSRRNSTYAFDGHGGLGRTESGSLGPKEWQAAPLSPTAGNDEPFGLLNGRAVALSEFPAGYLAWVDTGPATGYLQVVSWREPGFWKTGFDTGLVFRVADADNYFFAHTNGDPVNPATRKLIVGYRQAGRRNYLAVNLPMPAAWTRLQAVTKADGRIEIYADDTLVYTTTSDLFVGATGAGIYNDSDTHALHNRWDNFTVYTQP